MTTPELEERWRGLADELDNFQQIAARLLPSPGEVPRIAGIDIAGRSIPLNGVVGGDHILYIDFSRRYDLDQRIDDAQREGRDAVARKLARLRDRAGILVADVAGHRVTDALIAAMLHQAFLVGANYELDLFGEITTRLFEHINTRFYKTNQISKYFTMVYGEISSTGQFRFLSAAHRPPSIWSREFGRIMTVSAERLVSFPPVGMLPSRHDPDTPREPSLYGYKKRYEVNEINLMAAGDVLLLSTDGLTDHDDGAFFPARVEALLNDRRDASAGEICAAIEDAVLSGPSPEDDISFVAIKKTR